MTTRSEIMVIRIHHLSGALCGKVLSFEGKQITFGRRAGHDVEFDSNTAREVSADHAVIQEKGNSWVFRDQGSSNGSWIEGHRVEERLLKGGEEIELGKGGPLVRVEIVSAVESGKAVEAQPKGKSARQKPVGPKTVGMMIESALSEARDGQTGRVARTSFIRSVAKEAARHGSRRFKIGMVLIVLLLAGSVVFLVWELRRTREELEDVTLSKLGPSEIGEGIAAHNSRAIYLLIYRTRLGFEQGFCTGFAVSRTDLMTNAHCVVQIENLAREGSTFFAAPNEGMGARYQLLQWRSHSTYDKHSARPTPDIGVVKVNGELPSIVPLADTEQLAQLRIGAQIFVYGFPGDLSDVRSPVATITEGVLGRMTALDGLAAAPGGRHLLQYSAFTSKGTSGSPVFDKHGRVVAVNSGYYQGRSRVTIENPMTGKKEQANVSRDLSGYSFGIRIDLASGVLGIGLKQ